MKVAFVVGVFPAISETFILNQITGLIDRGHEVDIFPLHPPSMDFSVVHPNVEKYQLMQRVYHMPLVPQNYFQRLLKGLSLVLAVGWKDPLVLLRSLNVFQYGKQAASLRLLYQVIPLLGKGKYDIVHCQFGELGLRVMTLRQLGALSGKMVTAFRGHDISSYLQTYGDRVYDRLLATGDFFLTNCEYFKRRLLHLGGDRAKIAVHGSGIDCQRFSFTPRVRDPQGWTRIATTGRLVEMKGIEYSIRAVAKIAQVQPKIEYNIIGDGPLRQELQQLIQELNVSDNVKLLGAKDQRGLIEILNRSHIFIAPSVKAKDGNEDAPVNTLKEAMAMGLPVIATNHGGIPELVKDKVSGFLVPERDPEAIAAALAHLIEHPEIWAEMGQSGRAAVEQQYDTNKLNDELVEIYMAMTAPGDRQQSLPPVRLKPVLRTGN